MTSIYLLKALVSLGYNSVSKLLPAYLLSIGVSTLGIGFANGGYQAAKGLGGLLMGHVSDRVGRRRSVIVSLLAMATLSLLLGSVSSRLELPFAVVLLALIGFSAALLHLSLEAAGTTAREAHGASLGRLEASYQVGFIAGPMVGGLLAARGEIRGACMLWAGSAAIGAAVAVMSPLEEHRPRTRRRGVDVQRVLHFIPSRLGSASRQLLLGGFAVGLVEGMRDISLPLASRDLHISIHMLGLIFSCSAFVTLLAIPFAGRLSDQIGRATLLGGGLMLGGFGLLIISQSSNTAILAVGATSASVGRCMAYVAAKALAADQSALPVRASALSIFETAFAAGKVTGPLFLGGFELLSLWNTTTVFAAVALVGLGVHQLRHWRHA